uniref:Mediator of RNA polymerase II transcription subunit 13 n=1 Tax=Toxocara canis TaxID=6265 RepID=A0A183U8T3_TOXCA
LNGSAFPAPFPPFRMLLDPAIERLRLPPLVSPMDSDECASAAGDEEPSQSPPPNSDTKCACREKWTVQFSWQPAVGLVRITAVSRNLE